MADLKISQFASGGAVQTGDEIATNRGGANTKVNVGSAAALDVGTGIGDIPLLVDVAGNPGLPAVDGSNLLNLEGDIVANANGFQYEFDSSTSMANPGIGNFRLNNASPASATAIAVSSQTDATGNPDILAVLLTWDDSTSPVKGNLNIRLANGVFANYNITGLTNNTSWVQYAVTYVDSEGTLTDGDSSYFGFSRTGDMGASGSGSLDSVSGGKAINVNNTDPANPIVNIETGNFGDLAFDGSLGADGEFTLRSPAINGKTTAIPTTSDEFIFGDVSDSNNIKKNTIANLLALASGGALVYNSIGGFIPSSITGTSTTASLTVSAGSAADSGNTTSISKATTTSWAVSNGNAINGYQGGTTLPNSATIHFFICTGGSGTGVFAHNGLTPTPPAGYNTSYRRIFSLKTNSSGALLGGTAIEVEGGGMLFYLTTQILDISSSSVGTTRTLFTVTTPDGIRTELLFRTIHNTNASSIIFTSGDETDVAPSAANVAGFTAAPGFDLCYYNGSTNTPVPIANAMLTTNTSAQIGARADGASRNLYLVTRGYKDFRR